MQIHNIEKFVRGWFIGNFEPSLFKTDLFEVCYKKFKAGDTESKHYHRIATEYTLVTNGRIAINDVQYVEGDIIEVNPTDVVKFVAITDSSIIAVKIPCVKDDKYEIIEK
jgi:quercetin dioxygenase-like cupin family protein